MVEKAKYELDLILRQCEDQEDIEMQRMINNDILAIIELFASQGHSGFSANYAIPIINKLLKQSFILPLTGEDDEWKEVQPGCYQNKRESSIFKDKDRFDGKAYYIYGKAFSDNGGKSYYNTRDSHVIVEFPLRELPKTEYIIVEEGSLSDD
ncbi:MAG: hypothetical protein IKL08_05995 [Clostridia bacterium]|nr:hypothetical protein [Clostridia bacterium]